MVVATDPELGAKFMAEAPKPEPEDCDISKPVGGVTTILAVKLLPETVNDCRELATFGQAEKADSVPDALIVGGGILVNVTEIVPFNAFVVAQSNLFS